MKIEVKDFFNLTEEQIKNMKVELSMKLGAEMMLLNLLMND
ncbi:hypothetical protein [Mycoplasma sp. CSL10166]|nr:hypothetical protein [Mycoplasma sp. CSL10166]